jgi:oligopeptide/dipeptide ABC transporter ATP-binding protein
MADVVNKSTSPATHAADDLTLDLRGLTVAYHTSDGDVMAIQNASFQLRKGEVLGLVGESGCGKSTLGMGLLRLLRWPGHIVSGEAWFQGQNLFALSDSEMRHLRGDRLSMIFQNPMNSLNPTENIGEQLAEIIVTHRSLRQAEVRQRCIELLELVGIPGAKLRIGNYPHEFSGGMRQRVLIALALALEPELLVADEPTTALDLTVQGQILWLLENVQKRSQMAMVYITHNLAVAASISHRIAVMYAGWIIEIAPSDALFDHPAHPYSRGLIASVPKTSWREQRVAAIPGQPPRLTRHSRGCPFAPRCERVLDVCHEEMPPETEIAAGHVVRCFNAC